PYHEWRRSRRPKVNRNFFGTTYLPLYRQHGSARSVPKGYFMVALKVVAAAAIGAVVVAGVVYWEFDNLVPIVGLGVNYVRFFDAPKGTLTTEHGNAQSVGANNQPDSVRADPVQVQTAD